MIPLEIVRFPSFLAQLKSILKTYPKSESEIARAIDALATNPDDGDAYPGFGDVTIRKLRIGLSSYRLSARKGLRLLFLVLTEKHKVIPLIIYKKGTRNETEILNKSKQALRDILAAM